MCNVPWLHPIYICNKILFLFKLFCPNNSNWRAKRGIRRAIYPSGSVRDKLQVITHPNIKYHGPLATMSKEKHDICLLWPWSTAEPLMKCSQYNICNNNSDWVHKLVHETSLWLKEKVRGGRQYKKTILQYDYILKCRTHFLSIMSKAILWSLMWHLGLVAWVCTE